MFQSNNMHNDKNPIGKKNLPFRSVPLDEEAVIHPCNEKCYCTTKSYEPICGHDGVEYFSPCHAGCDNMTELENGDTVG